MAGRSSGSRGSSRHSRICGIIIQERGEFGGQLGRTAWEGKNVRRVDVTQEGVAKDEVRPLGRGDVSWREAVDANGLVVRHHVQ